MLFCYLTNSIYHVSGLLSTLSMHIHQNVMDMLTAGLCSRWNTQPFESALLKPAVLIQLTDG